MGIISLEIGEARQPTVCECCGAAIESTHGFIYRDDDAFAVYQAAWCIGHPENQVNARIEIGGDWGDRDSRPEHTFFGLLIFQTPDETKFSMIEADESMWPPNGDEGQLLSRDAALSHPLKPEIFHIAEHIASEDVLIKTFLDEHQIDA